MCEFCRKTRIMWLRDPNYYVESKKDLLFYFGRCALNFIDNENVHEESIDLCRKALSQYGKVELKDEMTELAEMMLLILIKLEERGLPFNNERLDQHSPNSPLKAAKYLIKKGKESRNMSTGDLSESIGYFSKALDLLKKRVSNNTCSGERHHAFVAHCLRAICTQETDPFSKSIFEDVKAALNIFCMDSSCPDNIMILLYSIIDLLHLKGFMELFKDAHELVIRFFKLKGVSMEKWLILLWESRRLTHALCVSPVNEALIQNSFSESSNLSNINSWLQNLKGSQSSLIGFQHTFSFLFESSHKSSCNHGSSFQVEITVDEVQKAALKLTSDVPVSRHCTFVAGYLYGDMCQRLIANGQLKEALSSAKEALRLHGSLIEGNYRYTLKKHNEENANNLGNDVIKLEVEFPITTEIFHFNFKSWDLNKSYLTPWKVMQCYLESLLQIAVTYEIMGFGFEAESYLIHGKQISCSLQLPLFIVSFSSLLGKLHVTKKCWDLAKTEFDHARGILNGNSTPFCCSKCKLILEATLDGYYGDLYQSKWVANQKGVSIANAEECYTSALRKLNCPENNGDSKCASGKSCTSSIMNEGNQISGPPDIVIQESNSTEMGCNISSTCAIPCVFPELECWNCFASEVLKFGLLKDFIILKLEFVRRKLSMKLLTRVGNCNPFGGEINKEQKYLVRSMSLLVYRNPACHSPLPIPLNVFTQMVIKKTPGDIFAIERAEIVYSLCWHLLNNFHPESARTIICNLSCITFENITSWLMVAFVISCEVPAVFQKVATLLSTMYVVSSLSADFSMPLLSDSLSENHCISFFNEISIGNYFNFQCHSEVTAGCKDQYVAGCSRFKEVTFDLLRISLDSTRSLAEYVRKFFDSLPPPTTIISISVLQHENNFLLNKLLNYAEPAWMLVSRLKYKAEPVVVILPMHSICEDTAVPSDHLVYEDCKKNDLVWHCPWGASAMVDDIAPAFRSILEKNGLSSQYDHKFHVPRQQKLRCELDHSLGQFLRNMEDVWLGSWIGLLLGELNCENFNSVIKKLSSGLRNLQLDIPDDFLRVIVGSPALVYDFKIDNDDYCGSASNGTFLHAFHVIVSSDTAKKLLFEALSELGGDDYLNREPVIFVLANEVQMLPWESLPTLRSQQIYRMPSVTSILYKNKSKFSSIDIRNSCCLLNPTGEFKTLQQIFEGYCDDRKIKVKAGSEPTFKEMLFSLENHDLFIYFGHGSGCQYIPLDEFMKLKRCAAGLLIGCSTGTLALCGSHAPKGTPWNYLLRGSPFIVSTLWEMVDFEVIDFAETILDEWLKERELPSREDSAGVAASMCLAREACPLRSLTGASFICYGTPTTIR